MKIDSNHYEMVIQQFLKMIRAKEVTPQLAGETIAYFLYSSPFDDAIEVLNHALNTVVEHHRGKQMWEEREHQKFLEDLKYAKEKMANI